MRRPLTILFPGLLVFALLTAGTLTTSTPAAAATIGPTTTCSNSMDNTPGLGVICEVTVANTFTALGGTATVTVRECHGAAGDPTASCSIITSVLTEPVTAVTQCNDATNGGGGTLRCSVRVTNTFVDLGPTVTAATVNQCVGSGDGIANNCDPFPATTSGATVTQCNGSANGGTLVGLTCTVTGTQPSTNNVLINQCNGSTNGGGALVICSATLENLSMMAGGSAAPIPTATPVPTVAPSGSPAAASTSAPVVTTAVTGPTPLPRLPDTSVNSETASQLGGPAPAILAAVLALVGLAWVAGQRRRNSH